MRENAKTLRRNSAEHEGILIGPSMAPRFSTVDEIHSVASHSFANTKSASGPNLAARMASRHVNQISLVTTRLARCYQTGHRARAHQFARAVATGCLLHAAHVVQGTVMVIVPTGTCRVPDVA